MSVSLAIEAKGLVKRFDGFTAVDGVDLAVPEGAIYGVLGPNGAGKTTTLRMLLGIIDPDAGVYPMVGPGQAYDEMITGDHIAARHASTIRPPDASEMF